MTEPSEQAPPPELAPASPDPAGAPADPPPARPRRTAVWVLAGVAVLLAVGVAALGIAFVNEVAKGERTLADQAAELADLESKVEGRETTLRDQRPVGGAGAAGGQGREGRG